MTIPFPKEHGAYGQIAFPLIAAFGVAGVSAAGLLFAALVVAVFLAHEPTLIVLGHRGARARRERRRPATVWLACLAVVAATAAVAMLLTLAPSARWSIVVPLAPAILLAGAVARGAEKSGLGETATSLACSGAAIPVAIAGGASPVTAAAVAIPFALLFVSSTVAVRAAILGVRGGGDPKAAATSRWIALGLVVTASVAVTFASAVRLLPAPVVFATAPGLITAFTIAMWPPAPTRLRALGWTLVAVSLLTTVIVVVTNQP